ncbi:hypothetical protein D0U02_24345, partial [Burkholderia pseudomallei]
MSSRAPPHRAMRRRAVRRPACAWLAGAAPASFASFTRYARYALKRPMCFGMRASIDRPCTGGPGAMPSARHGFGIAT